MPASTTFPPCPTCGSTDGIRIVYGYPPLELWQAEQRGEIVLGGCVIGPESPDYECRSCGVPLPWVAKEQVLDWDNGVVTDSADSANARGADA